MGILRTDRVSGLGGANAIKGSVFFGNGDNNEPSSSGASGNDFLRTEHSSNFTFGTGDLTMEGWFFIETLADNYQSLIADSIYYAQGGFTLYINNTQLIMYDGQGGGIVNGGTLTAAKWSHIAYSRESNSHKLFIDGELVATASSSYEFTGTDIIIGANKVGQSNNADTGGYPFRGFASNVRIIKGRALYTATFTPPKGELEVTSDTVLLCCQSPGNVLQEATGVTLTTSTHRNSSGAKASHFTPNSPVGFSTTTDVGTQFGSTFDGVTTFDSQAYMVPPGGNTRERNRGRGIYGLGGFPSYVSTIDFLAIQSTGNAQVFGDLTVAASFMAAAGSQTRAVFSRRYNASGGNNTMDFVTIANTANAIDFGDATTTAHAPAGCGNNTRGLFGGGATTNILEFITFATAGNAQDFGDLYSKRDMGGLSNSTRGVFAGGGDAPQVNTIQFVTISTTGNGSDFGDLTQETQGLTGSSNSTRGIFAGGYTPTMQNTIQFITIATTGNATDFGDLTFTSFRGASCSSPTRSVIMRGWSPAGNVNDICFIEISSTGDASDFGDKTSASGQMSESGTSDCHGGLE